VIGGELDVWVADELGGETAEAELSAAVMAGRDKQQQGEAA
jgi:hypothetical protein